MKNTKQNFDSLEKKFGKLDTALYKSFEKYHEKCKDLADFLIKMLFPIMMKMKCTHFMRNIYFPMV